MANPVAYGVKLEDYTLGATSTNASYPLANLQTYFAADKWQANNTSATNLVIDFGAARSCDYIIIENHNLNTANISGGENVVALEAADDSGFTTNKVTVLDDVRSSSSPVKWTFNAVSKRYWRLAAPAATAAIYVGNLYLGTAFSFGSPPEYPFRLGDPQYATSEAVALNGAIRMSQPFLARYYYDFKFRLQSDTVKTNLITFLQTVRGKLRPFYFLNPIDGTTLWYVHLDSDFNPADVINYGLNDILTFRLKTQLVS
jgi:hypothetical protein